MSSEESNIMIAILCVAGPQQYSFMYVCYNNIVMVARYSYKVKYYIFKLSNTVLDCKVVQRMN